MSVIKDINISNNITPLSSETAREGAGGEPYFLKNSGSVAARS